MNHKQEIGIGIFFLTLAALYLAGSLSISTFNPFGNRGLTSQSIPQLLGGLTAVLSLIHIAANIISLNKSKAASPESDGKKPKIRLDKSLRLMLLSVLFICIYVFLFTRLGFILSSVLFLLAEIFLLIPAERRKSWAPFIICFSIGLPVLLYLLFTKPLAMFLPRGLLG